MTYSEAYAYGDRELNGSGIAEHDIDSLLLLTYVTGKDRTFILTHGDEESLTDEELKQYKEAVLKRSRHIPLQHITGETDFMGLKFHVSEDVLIPRIDTEFLVEEALKLINDGAEILDMCSGSGCILLSLMKYKNDIRGVGADISDAAIALAKKNAEDLDVNDAVFLKSDLFSEVEGLFDLIISNPPYIKSEDIKDLMEEVRCHEPHTALDGGEDGLSFYRRIAAEAKEHLVSGGHLMVETGHDEGEDVGRIFEEERYKNIRVLRDYSGNERVVICLKS